MSEVRSNATYPITGIYSFGRGLIKRPAIGGDGTSYQRMARLKTGQVVMSKLNAWEGALAVVDDSFSGTYVSPEYPVFSIDSEKACISYLEHLLKWPEFWRQLTPRGSMVRRKRTTPATLLATNVPLPCLSEQHRIADKLDATMSRIARFTDLRENSKLIADQYMDSLFQSIETRDSLSVALRVSGDSVAVEPGSKYSITGIYSFGRGLIKRPIIRGSDTSYTSFTRLRAGQVVMSKLNAWEGALAVVSDAFDKTYVSPEYPTFDINDSDVDPSYIEHLLGWPRLWASLTPRGSMARRKRTTPATLLATKVPLPELSEQRRIAGQLTLVRRATQIGAKQAAQVAKLRTALLDAAFSGQL
ncbi:restriction endonuclease subunit S [Nocardia ignorata]|uniref:restriction endonuclease subunit S n=1 Tax=Nocardia ignorata TaxID=145285 RepID=UPI00362B619C